ncbi:hypothetical protein BZG02_13620 [Labilibaculum filiforme]|uniref:Uncharacterized protein n=1 Tax=Labilibaculum filiforme TaxID=1940526 RepID=A0A2N3HV88_9BACT|nr:flotillin-like FloA family protein [Labilibaculum filiforme]PKQ61974.1 hypothetical protein BZG02_13620 [Labilibaculum filiforme]
MIEIFIVSIIIALIFTPTIFKFIQAIRMGAKISFERGMGMSFRKTFKMELIKAIALSQKLNYNIDLYILEAHFLAGGSPLRCVEALEYAKQKGIHLEFSLVAGADLAGKDLIDAINKTKEIFKLEFSESRIQDSKLNFFKFEFKGEYKLNFGGVCFATIDKKQLIKEVKEKLTKYLENSEPIGNSRINKILSEVIFDDKYWESKGLILVNQEVTLQPIKD